MYYNKIFDVLINNSKENFNICRCYAIVFSVLKSYMHVIRDKSLELTIQKRIG